MKLEHSFTVPVGVDEAWKILLDIERIGPCMPGAAIDSVDGDDFTGTVKVKLGPIGLTYKGKASFVEKDDAAHRAVIDARGKDARGNGTAAAKVTATLTGSGSETTVRVDTDLDITGKPAQFGRGVMVDVGNKLIGQFADNLAKTLHTDEPAAEAVAEPAATGAKRPSPRAASAGAGASDATPDLPPAAERIAATGASRASVNGSGPRRIAPADPEPINLIESAGPAVAKRLAPLAVAAVVVLLAVRRRRR